MNIDINQLYKHDNQTIEKIILSHKNPEDIAHISTTNQIWFDLSNDPNSNLWYKLLMKHYTTLFKYKLKSISCKDYYVLLFYAELLGIHLYTPIINKAQHIINLLPKIYHGDHITILNASINTAITSNKANIILYRDPYDNNNINSGNGCLVIRYLNTPRDIYTNINHSRNLPLAKHVNPIYGGYRPI